MLRLLPLFSCAFRRGQVFLGRYDFFWQSFVEFRAQRRLNRVNKWGWFFLIFALSIKSKTAADRFWGRPRRKMWRVQVGFDLDVVIYLFLQPRLILYMDVTDKFNGFLLNVVIFILQFSQSLQSLTQAILRFIVENGCLFPNSFLFLYFSNKTWTLFPP